LSNAFFAETSLNIEKMKNQITNSTNKKNLLQLILLRTFAIIAQLVTIIFVSRFLEIDLPEKQMFFVLLLLLILNFISFYRYRYQKNISDISLFFELILDVTAFAAQLYFSGGISNPFISLFLLQVIIAAILLRPIFAWIIAVVTIFCYILLSFKYNFLHEFHHHENSESLFSLHLQGMLISYVVAAILLLIFITRMAKNLRERDRKSEEEKQILRSAMLATAAAHDLGTPLNTITVVLEDWKNFKEKNSASDLKQDIKLIENQIERCKKAVSQILLASGNQRLEESNANLKN